MQGLGKKRVNHNHNQVFPLSMLQKMILTRVNTHWPSGVSGRRSHFSALTKIIPHGQINGKQQSSNMFFFFLSLSFFSVAAVLTDPSSFPWALWGSSSCGLPLWWAQGEWHISAAMTLLFLPRCSTSLKRHRSGMPEEELGCAALSLYPTPPRVSHFIICG